MACKPKDQEQIIAADKSTTKAGTDWWVRDPLYLAHERAGNSVKPFIDGKYALADIAERFRNAQKYIYITDWMFTPIIRLVRNGPLKTNKYPAASGENLSDIAKKYNTTASEIRRLNPPTLTKDYAINLPSNSVKTRGDMEDGYGIPNVYHGKKGDKIRDIAIKYNITMELIDELNLDLPITIPIGINRLTIAQELNVPSDPDILVNILAERASKGVLVRILLWDSADITEVQDNHDKEAESILEAAHENIRVQRHSNSALYWSHHMKSIVVDGKTAYLGGIDLCRGRWDDHTHPVVATEEYHEGVDFYNARLETPGQPFYRAILDYDRDTRQPWHDVHIRIDGPAVYDVETNFYQRWDYEHSSLFERDLSNKPQLNENNEGNQKVQILRSIDYASINLDDYDSIDGIDSATAHKDGKECSIYQAYQKAINNSKYYIYIENQFFISNFGDKTIENKLADSLAERVDKAIKNKQKFKIVIVTPAFPEGSVFVGTLAGQLDLEYKTLGQPPGVIRKGTPGDSPNGLMNKIVKSIVENKLARDADDAWNNGHLQNYIGVYCLRNHGKLPSGEPVHDLVYVHTKVMIVDDHVFIAGSANTNDRSMLGDRDSELAALIEDDNKKIIEIDGSKTEVRKMAHELRVALWAEHLGLEQADHNKIEDPYKGFDLLREQAKRNTDIYVDAFPDVPSDIIHTMKDYQSKISHKFKESEYAEINNKLQGIKGHITQFPLHWLSGEDLKYLVETPLALNENETEEMENTSRDV